MVSLVHGSEEAGAWVREFIKSLLGLNGDNNQSTSTGGQNQSTDTGDQNQTTDTGGQNQSTDNGDNDQTTNTTGQNQSTDNGDNDQTTNTGDENKSTQKAEHCKRVQENGYCMTEELKPGRYHYENNKCTEYTRCYLVTADSGKIFNSEEDCKRECSN